MKVKNSGANYYIADKLQIVVLSTFDLENKT